MSENKPTNLTDRFVTEALTAHLRKRAEERWEDAKKEMLAKMDEARDREIAAAVLHIFSMVNVREMGSTTVIEVRKVDGTPND